MDLEKATISLFWQDPWRMACLRAGRALGVNDWYLAAGFVRNLIWDRLHSKKTATPLNDLDFVYFDTKDRTIKTEKRFEDRLIELMPGPVWQVRNQARMHIRNSHPAYRHTEDAMAHWPEVPTCVGARLSDDDKIEIAAPFGLAENWSAHVRPNQVVPYPPEIFTRRVKDKNWLEIWPDLKIYWPGGLIFRRIDLETE